MRTVLAHERTCHQLLIITATKEPRQELQTEAAFIRNCIPRDDSYIKNHSPPVEVSLAVGDVLVPLLALVEVHALGLGAP